MYVCVCKAITEQVLNEQITICESVEELVLKTGASDCCGSCRNQIEMLFNEKHILK